MKIRLAAASLALLALAACSGGGASAPTVTGNVAQSPAGVAAVADPTANPGTITASPAPVATAGPGGSSADYTNTTTTNNGGSTTNSATTVGNIGGVQNGVSSNSGINSTTTTNIGSGATTTSNNAHS